MSAYNRLTIGGFQGFVIAVLVITPSISTRLSAHDLSRLVEVLLLAYAPFVLVCTLLASAPLALLVSRRTAIAATLLLLLVIFSSIRANDHIAALQDLGHHFGLVGLSLAFAISFKNQTISWFERGLAISPVALAIVISGIFTASWAQSELLNARQMHVGFDNPRFLNHAQTVFVPWLVMVFPLGESKRLWRQLAWLAATIHVSIAYVDVARGTWLAWFAAILVVRLYGTQKNLLRLSTVLIVGLLLGVLIADVLPATGAYQWNSPFASKAAASGTHSRDQLLNISLEMIKSAPWLGHGGMSFAANLTARATHPHNIYLQWAAEYGIPSMVIAISFLLTLLVKALKQIRRGSSLVGDRLSALLAICTAALADALVSGNFVMPVSQIWIAVVVGQLIAATSVNIPCGTDCPSNRTSHTRLALACALCVSQLLMLWATLHQVARPEPRIHESTETIHAGDKIRPRYWLNGQL